MQGRPESGDIGALLPQDPHLQVGRRGGGRGQQHRRCAAGGRARKAGERGVVRRLHAGQRGARGAAARALACQLALRACRARLGHVTSA
jgi:hypothetical protein